MIDVILERHVETSGVQYLLNIPALPKELLKYTQHVENNAIMQ